MRYHRINPGREMSLTLNVIIGGRGVNVIVNAKES